LHEPDPESAATGLEASFPAQEKMIARAAFLLKKHRKEKGIIKEWFTFTTCKKKTSNNVLREIL